MKGIFEIVFWALAGWSMSLKARIDPPCPKSMTSVIGAIVGILGGIGYKYLFHTPGDFTNIDLIASFFVILVLVRFVFHFLCPPINRKNP